MGIAIVILAIIAVPMIQIALGYHFQPGWEVARNLVERGNSVRECEKVRVMPWNMIGPTESQQRGMCIYEYAKLTKDPSACELLMPSEYGWSCVGGAQEKEPCSFGTYANPTVNGNGIIATLQECIDGPQNKRLNSCCLIAKIKYTDEENNCDMFRDKLVFLDQCHHEMAIKKKDGGECSFILSRNIRTACEVQTRALMLQ